MTFAEIARLVLAAPGIEQGFFQHYIGLHLDKSARNQGGGFKTEHTLPEYFRVVLYCDRSFDATKHEVRGGMAEVENPDLLAAVREAFAKLNLPLPKEMAPTKKKA